MNNAITLRTGKVKHYKFAVECLGRTPSPRKLAQISYALLELENCVTLDDIVDHLTEMLPSRQWFIYKGGSHIAIHERRLSLFVKNNSLLVIRRTTAPERMPMVAAFRSESPWQPHVRLLSALHSPEGARLHRDLTIQIERDSTLKQRGHDGVVEVEGDNRFRKAKELSMEREVIKILETEAFDQMINTLPKDVQMQLIDITEAFARNASLLQNGDAYGISFGSSPLVKQYLRNRYGLQGEVVASGMRSLKSSNGYQK